MSVRFAPLWLMLPVALLLLNACAPAPIVTPEPFKPEASKPQKPESVVVQEKPELSVAILMSSPAKVFAETARDITSALKQTQKQNVTEVVFTGDKKKDTSLIEKIRTGHYSHVVALGKRAANAAARLHNELVVFSHVFNDEDPAFASNKMKGVSFLPSPDQLFKDWKALSPTLESVALLTSKNHDHYVAVAKKAADKQGIKLVHQVVENDKEFVYVSKRLPPTVQGQWILPDYKILSRSALKTVVSFNAKNGKQSVVFSKGLLSFGALLYVNVPNATVADLVVERLRDSLGKKTIPGQDVLIARHHNLVINKKVAGQLNLTIPPQYQHTVSR